MSNQWNEIELETLSQLIDKPIVFIYHIFNTKRQKKEVGFDCERSLESISRKIRRIKSADISVEREETDKKWDSLEYITSKYKEEAIPFKVPTNGKDRFILTLSDLHLPFTEISNIKFVLSQYASTLANNNGLIVLNGDILDEYCASNFAKHKRVAILDEYKAGFNILKLCLDYSDKVALVMGNHDNRISRVMGEHLDKDLHQIVPIDLLAKMANGEILNDFGMVEQIDEDVRARTYYNKLESWYIRVGKTIFAHPSGYKSGVCGTTTFLYNTLRKRYLYEDFDALCIGHTHQQSKIIYDNCMLMEQGAMCGRQGYEFRADLAFRAANLGYAYIWQDSNGRTNFNESNFVNMGCLVPKKKMLI